MLTNRPVYKRVDPRLFTHIENGVIQGHRSMFVIAGTQTIQPIVHLHTLLSRAVQNLVSSKYSKRLQPTILWCYKDAHPPRGEVVPFAEMTTYCQYEDSERILVNTFGMCILQEFEALSPNLLARTIETVEGGGLILLLLPSSLLTSLFTMVKDLNVRFRPESDCAVTWRFNERLLLSAVSCEACLVIDEEINILPISSHVKSIMPVPAKIKKGISGAERQAFKSLKEKVNDDFPVDRLIEKCTDDQWSAVIALLDAILNKKVFSTVALLAGRGRGKSAALGLAIAGAIASQYSNIYVTAPSPENLKTLFQFVHQGLNSLGYEKDRDYEVLENGNTMLKMEFKINKAHKQTIQYVKPDESQDLTVVDLLVIDEATAIPLPVLKSLLGSYHVLLSSTVNDYEGTARSLSLKMLQQLSEIDSNRVFKTKGLWDAIRYQSGDPIESWLHKLLCLDVTNSIPDINRLPRPSECVLYYVNRDTLFSCVNQAEIALQRMMGVYFASHYKISPDDLKLITDAPDHHLFVLLGPADDSRRNQVPDDILCVIQIALEGENSPSSAISSLCAGHQPSEFEIPYNIRNKDFECRSGARIIRIATHPELMKHGYGSAAVELLSRYYEGKFDPVSEADVRISSSIKIVDTAEKALSLVAKGESVTGLPPLFECLSERLPEKVDYLSVSFGHTSDLFRFWKRLNFVPYYICNSPNAVTGEHTCMVLKPLDTEESWFSSCYKKFRESFAQGQELYPMNFYQLAMSLLEPFDEADEAELTTSISREKLAQN